MEEIFKKNHVIIIFQKEEINKCGKEEDFQFIGIDLRNIKDIKEK